MRDKTADAYEDGYKEGMLRAVQIAKDVKKDYLKNNDYRAVGAAIAAKRIADEAKDLG